MKGGNPLFLAHQARLCGRTVRSVGVKPNNCFSKKLQESNLTTSDQRQHAKLLSHSLNALEFFSFSAPLLTISNWLDQQVLFQQWLWTRINNQQHQSEPLFRKTKNYGACMYIVVCYHLKTALNLYFSVFDRLIRLNTEIVISIILFRCTILSDGCVPTIC